MPRTRSVFRRLPRRARSRGFQAVPEAPPNWGLFLAALVDPPSPPGRFAVDRSFPFAREAEAAEQRVRGLRLIDQSDAPQPRPSVQRPSASRESGIEALWSADSAALLKATSQLCKSGCELGVRKPSR